MPCTQTVALYACEQMGEQLSGLQRNRFQTL